MLSRIADNLYWMARNIERAENTARMLDIAHRMALLPTGLLEPAQEWDAPLLITGQYATFFAKQPVRNEDSVIQFLALDPDNPSSIYSCIEAARENGRSVRGAITAEMWEDLNATWLEIRDMRLERIRHMGPREFFEWVKSRSHLFRGVTVGTMLRDEAFHFIRLGTFIERADNTARILDVKYHILLPSVTEVGGAADYYQWGALLRSVSAFQAYRKAYREQIKPLRVAELLILREDMPRSLHACMNEVQDILAAIGNPGEPQRLAGELHAGLHYGRVDDIFVQGLHEYLSTFLSKVARLGNEISRNYFAARYA
jgi:uncharacterized alpha-E superfamily protein